MTSCENYNLQDLSCLPQAIEGVGSDIYSGCGLVSVRESDCYYVVYCMVLVVFNAVDKGLIQIEDYGLFYRGLFVWRKENLSLFYYFRWNWIEVIFDVL